MAVDRTLLTSFLDFSSRINKDGQVATVCSDAKIMLQWYEMEMEKLIAKNPLKRAVIDVGAS